MLRNTEYIWPELNLKQLQEVGGCGAAVQDMKNQREREDRSDVSRLC